MTSWESWVKRPQNLWVRKALFQIHLWTGIAVGIYVLAVSVSGSAIVFRNELYLKYGPKPTLVDDSGRRLNGDELRDAARRAHPSFAVARVWESRRQNEAVEIWMTHDGKQIQRLFDPYTGKDVGPAVPYIIATLAWLKDLHLTLLAGDTGRIANGIGAILLTLLSITGVIIWWPGIKNWRRSLTIETKANWKRINWDLHSAIGFWTLAFMFMWGVTGVYVVWPTPFQKAIDRFAPLDRYRLVTDSDIASPPAPSATPVQSQVKAKFVLVADEAAPPPQRRVPRPPPRMSFGDQIVRWSTYLHFGNFAGWKVKALWTFLGLIPAFLFVTGTIMWWNRVIVGVFARRRAARRPSLSEVAGSRTLDPVQ